ncbi:MAG: pyruvate kinase [Thermoplasmataceae archaeon]
MKGVGILVTVGPSCDSVEKIESLARLGAAALRINTAHISRGYIPHITEMAGKANRKHGTHVGIVVDLKGPELRTGEFENGEFHVRKNTNYTIGSQGSSDISVNTPTALEAVSEGDSVIMSDGAVRFRVTAVAGGKVTVRSSSPGLLRNRSRVNIPGRLLNLGAVTPRDMEFIRESVGCGVDFFALSFVQERKNVSELSSIIQELGSEAEIISKIETRKGLENLDEIAASSDWIMVARGDLGVEVPLKEVAMAQKKIILESHRHGIPTIVATQMLESMVEKPAPTRAEVSDVSNAILDNADALMLSEETAIGRFPLEAARYLRDIADYVETRANGFPEPENFLGNRIAYSIARASKIVSEEIDSDAILAFTKSGSTARMISAVRPNRRIVAAVTSESLARRLNLLRGVDPMIIPEEYSESRTLNEVIDYLETTGTFRLGQRIVVTSGSPYFLFGGTNDVRVITSGKFLGRGYPAGKSLKGKITMNRNGKGDILLADGITSPETIQGFKGLILRKRVPSGIRDDLRSSGKTVVYGTRFVLEPEEGDEVYIDTGTGVILGSSRKDKED